MARRQAAAAGVALLALAGIAALVLGVLLATGPRALSASGGAAARPAVLASGQSGTRQARVQLAGEESEATDGVVSNDDEEDEEEEPPFGEPQGLPAEACDMEALQNCLGAMMAQTDSLPEGERALLLKGEDEEIAHEFCAKSHEPFECACRACDLSKLSTWDNDYWTKDSQAKAVIEKMRTQARCQELKQHGAANFPPGHGCNNLYHTACEKPLRSDWCPMVLDPKKFQVSRYGVAGTMLNDHTAWINADYTCKDEMGSDRERDCKTAFKHAYHDGNAYCAPMHNFIKCMCNACEHDVETLVPQRAHARMCCRLVHALACAFAFFCLCHCPLPIGAGIDVSFYDTHTLRAYVGTQVSGFGYFGRKLSEEELKWRVVEQK